MTHVHALSRGPFRNICLTPASKEPDPLEAQKAVQPDKPQPTSLTRVAFGPFTMFGL